MKRIYSIIMEWGLGLPTGTIAFWGTLVPRILTVDHTFKYYHDNVFTCITEIAQSKYYKDNVLYHINST